MIFIHHLQKKEDLFSKYLRHKENKKMETKNKTKKSDFQKEIENDEKRLKEIYNKILGLNKYEYNLEVLENNCLLS